MTFLWPMALALLVPWGVACWRLARRGDTSRAVPFVRLWPTSPGAGTSRRGRPPAWVMGVLAGTLLAILAAAGPAWRTTAAGITVVVDRHPAMTPTRLRQAFDRLNLPAATVVRVIPVPGEPFTGFDTNRLKPTAVDTADALQRIVRALPGPAVVLTDRPLDLPAGVIAVAPPPLKNAGIDRFAVTPLASARAAAWVRVFNATSQTKAILEMAGTRQAIDLPPAGETKDSFFDFAPSGDTLTVRLRAADGTPWRDDVPGDDAAFLARSAGGGRVEPRTAVSEALGRFIAVYARHRPAEPGATAVEIVRGDTAGDGAAGRPAVVLPTALAAGDALAVTLDASHAVSRSLDPKRLTGRPTPSRPPGDGWRTLATAGDAALLAVRETNAGAPAVSSAARQIWVGFDSDAFANDAAYVLFWADAFDWLAGGAPEWRAAAVGGEDFGRTGRVIFLADPNLDKSPGLYADDTGKPVATAMPAVRPGVGGGVGGGEEKIGAAVAWFSRQNVPIGAYVLLAGTVLIAAGLAAGRLDRN